MLRALLALQLDIIFPLLLLANGQPQTPPPLLLPVGILMLVLEHLASAAQPFWALHCTLHRTCGAFCLLSNKV